ncbi:MAG TPA: IS256 family transposase [Phycisphaerae bacterium]|nr:IS256 family transposase [Phycisphaerae bacterium]
MKTLPLSQQLEQLKESLLSERQEGAPLEGLLRRAGKMVIEELLQGEVADALGRESYERRENQAPAGYRNGYKTRRVKTGEGAITVEVPQVRGREDFASRLWPLIKQASPALEKMVIEMYARGLSTRDIEELLKTLSPEELEGRPLLSRSAVSEVTDALLEEHNAFVERDLAGHDVVYLFADAVFESLRAQGCRQAILVTWGICIDGAKVLLHLSVGNKESADAWTEHFRSLVKRNMKSPLTITTDGAPGLIKAAEGMWPESSRIRCWFHKMKNVLEKVPENMHGPIKALLQDVREAPDHATGEKRARELIRDYGQTLPAAMACLEEDLQASLEHLKLPLAHRKCVRTTNLCERSFVEERRRAKVIPRFRSEQECMKLVYASLIRASARWQRVRFTTFEKESLKEYIEKQRKLGKQARDLLPAA